MQKLVFTITGKKGLLMNSTATMLAKAAEEAKKKPGKGSKTEEPRDPPDVQAKKNRYADNGMLYVLAEAVRKCVLTAAKKYKVKPPGARTSSSAQPFVAGAMSIGEPFFYLMKPGTGEFIAEDDYTVDARRVVIQKSAIVRGRAHVYPWSCVCVFEFDFDRVTLDLMEQIISEAGTYPGLMDYRPEKGGWFGTFTLNEIHKEE